MTRKDAEADWAAFARQVGGVHRRSGLGWRDEVSWVEAGWSFGLARWSDLNANSNSLGSVYTARLQTALRLRGAFEMHVSPVPDTPELVLLKARGKPITTGIAPMDSGFEIRGSDPQAAIELLSLDLARAFFGRWPRAQLHIGARRNWLGRAERSGRGQLVLEAEQPLEKSEELQRWRGAAVTWVQALLRLGIAEPA